MDTMTSNALTAPIKTSDNEQLAAGATHLAAMFMAFSTGWAAGAGGMLAGLVVWLLARHRHPLVARHAAEVFNFNFSLFVYLMAAIVFTVVTLGIGVLIAGPLAAVFAIIWIIASIVGAIAGFNGREFRYPLTIRILRP